jgi:hypothetical protein
MAIVIACAPPRQANAGAASAPPRVHLLLAQHTIAREKASLGIRVISIKAGTDDKTPGGVGIDVLTFPDTSDERNVPPGAACSPNLVEASDLKKRT